jgi:signal peptidase I
MSTVLLILLLFAASELNGALFLWLGTRWLGISGTSYRKALAAVIAITCIGLLLHAGLGGAEALNARFPLVWPLIESVTGLVLSWLVIKGIFQTSLAKAMLAWLTMLFAVGTNLAVVYLVVMPFALESFVIASNSMAPTLLGPHQLGTCPYCGQSMVVPYDPGIPWMNAQSLREELSICSSCLQTAIVRADSAHVLPADRHFTNKLLSPRRWDLVVYRSPDNRPVKYVKRLVGLPGEEVVIKEGAIWVDGQKMTPPQEIAGLQFLAAPQGLDETWGSPSRPARLGVDEYFVVGDFSLRSADSRTWGTKVNNHPAYALPRSYIEGVATIIYWPPLRWRILR